MSDIISAFGMVAEPFSLGCLVFGVWIGILFGAMPGLSVNMGLALLLPLAFAFKGISGILMLLGIYCGAIYGGSISAILLKTPGTPASVATTLDGYPMATKLHQPGRALGISTMASTFGGIFSTACLIIMAPLLAKVALQFSKPEYFALAIFGLSVIVSISGNSVIKGVMSGLFGLLLCTIGSDPISGYPRWIFGNMQLYEGPPFIPTLIGLFAVSEILSNVENFSADKKIAPEKVTQVLPTVADMKRCLSTYVKGGIIGTFIGSIPGAGGDIAAFVSYGEAKRSSKTPEKFGTGMIEGVAASESANNGCSGGAMIPLLSLGVPGDSVTAILLGAFIIHGLQPGPLLYKDHMDVVYMVFASLLVANIAMFILGAIGVRFFSKVIAMDKRLLLPIIFILSMTGSYSMRNSLFDVFLTLAFGVIGFLMQRYGFPLAPILLALILGPMAESNLRRFLVIAQGDASQFIGHPIAMTLFILAAVSLVLALVSQHKTQQRLKANAGSTEEDD